MKLLVACWSIFQALCTITFYVLASIGLIYWARHDEWALALLAAIFLTLMDIHGELKKRAVVA